MGSSWFSSGRSSISVSLPAREPQDTPAEVLGKGYPPRGKNPQQFQFRQNISCLEQQQQQQQQQQREQQQQQQQQQRQCFGTLQATAFIPYTSLPHSL
ncbi:Mastermind-like domain-containing protein 1, partial [Ophiophagus hannah]